MLNIGQHGNCANRRHQWKRKRNYAIFTLKNSTIGNLWYRKATEVGMRQMAFYWHPLNSLYTWENKYHFKAHSNLIPAWREYLAWVFIQPMVKMTYFHHFKNTDKEQIPTLLELEQIAVYRASELWGDLGNPIAYDYFLDPKFHLARTLHASSNQFFALSMRPDKSAFLQAVATRLFTIEKPYITVEQYLRRDLTKAQRQAAEMILKDWERIFL